MFAYAWRVAFASTVAILLAGFALLLAAVNMLPDSTLGRQQADYFIFMVPGFVPGAVFVCIAILFLSIPARVACQGRDDDQEQRGSSTFKWWGSAREGLTDDEAGDGYLTGFTSAMLFPLKMFRQTIGDESVSSRIPRKMQILRVF